MKKSSITLFHLTAHLQNIFTQGRRMPISEKRPGKTSVHKLLIFLFAFNLFGEVLNSQTTITYVMQDANFPTQFNDGGDFFNNGGAELGMWANSGNKKTVAWRTYKTAGDNTGSNRSLQVGDVFKITVAATRAFGQIGFSLNAGGTQGSSYDNRVSGSRLYFNTDNYAAWYVNRSGDNTSLSFVPLQNTVKDYIFTIRITSSTTADVYLTVDGTDYKAYNLTMNGSGNIDSFSIYGADIWDGDSNDNAYWKQPSTVTNSKRVELGYYLGSGTYTPGVISDGLDAGSTSTSSVNDVYAGGDAGTYVILNQTNTYTGSTTVNPAARLELQNTAALGSTTGVTVSSNATLSLYFASGTNTFNSYATTLNGSGQGGSNGALRSTGGNNTWPGGITLASASRINADASGAAGSLTLSGTVTLGSYALTVGGTTSGVTISGKTTGTGGIVKEGNNKLTLSNTSNDYTGTTTISAGTLELGGADVIPNNAMTLSGGTLSTGSSTGYNETIGVLTLSSSSTISFGSGSHTLTFSASNVPAWSGTLTISNWTSTGAKLYFGTNGSGLTSTQLNNINFTGFGNGARILSTGEVIPATYYSAVATGSWNAGSSWLGGSAPSASTDKIVIQSGHNITLNTDATVASLTINSGGTFTASDGSARILTITKLTSGNATTISNSGTWTNNGSKTSTVVFTGAPSGSDAVHAIYCVDNISNVIVFQNITVYKTGGNSNVGCSFGTRSSVSDTLEIGSGGFIATAPPASFYGTSAVLKFNQGVGKIYDVGTNDFTWSSTVIPQYIAIRSGTVNLNASRVATGDLLINGGTLYLAADLTIQGNWTRTSGTFTPNLQTVTLSGGTLNTVISTATDATLYDLVVSKTDGKSVSLSSNLTVTHDMTINSGAIFTIPAAKSLTVTGVFANSGTVTLQSPATLGAPGSLITNGTVSGNIVVERYIPQWTTPTNGWHLISSPVNNIPIAGSNLAPGSSDDLYKYDEVSNMWLNYKLGANNITNFTNGIGFLCSYAANATKSFTQVPNTADVTFNNLTLTGTRGWNLLGNPFPCAIKWNDGNWTLTNVSTTAKVMNPGGTYTDKTANGIIPAMQGFFVQVTSGTGIVKIPKLARTHDATTDFYKETAVQSEKLMLTAKSNDNNTYVETVVKFDPMATAQFDNNYDANFLQGIEEAPQLYSVINSGELLSTNTFPPSSLAEVPVNFIKGISSNYTLDASGIESFNPDVTILLEDLKTGAIQNLIQNQVYPFTSVAGDNPNRFKLHFKGTLSIEDKKSEGYLRVYSSGRTLCISNSNTNEISGSVVIYNLLGQEIATQKLDNAPVTKINVNTSTGYYLVKVITENQSFTTKIFLN